MWQECSWKYIIGRFGLGKYSRSRMSVWEMDCSGKGSVVFRLRNNFLHFWGSCFLLLLFFFFLKAEQELAGVGYTCPILSLGVCLRHLKLEVDHFSRLRNGPNKIAIPMTLQYTFYSLKLKHIPAKTLF